MQALEAVHAVEQVESRLTFADLMRNSTPLSLEKARQRIPEHMKDTAPYSVNALWTFYLDTDHDPIGESCIYCKMFDGQTFTGSQLRTVFPDHEWRGDDIYANVHKTLWNRDGTCACLLIREDDKWGENVNLNLWSQIGTDWTKGPNKTTEEEET